MLTPDELKYLEGAEERRLKDKYKGLDVSGEIIEIWYPEGNIYLGNVHPDTQIRNGTGVLILVEAIFIG